MSKTNNTDFEVISPSPEWQPPLSGLLLVIAHLVTQVQLLEAKVEALGDSELGTKRILQKMIHAQTSAPPQEATQQAVNVIDAAHIASRSAALQAAKDLLERCLPGVELRFSP